jgi:hypothetical protein
MGKVAAMDGIILNYDPISATGTIQSGGKMYPFKRADWQERRAPRINNKVEFEVEGDSAVQILHMLEEDRLPTAAEKFVARFDFGLIAGGYAVIFFLVYTIDSFVNIINIDANDAVILFVILDILTVAAWIRGTNYKIMRGVATVFAVALTSFAAFILLWHILQGEG